METFAPAELRLNGELLEAFLAGTSGTREENVLAEQVTYLLPFHPALPDRIAADLSRLIGALGGEQCLLDWLARRAGRPRLVSHLYRLIGVLNWYGADLAIVAALREVRARSAMPRFVAMQLAPDTDAGTLPSLAWTVETLLGAGRLHQATRLAFGAASMFEKVALRAKNADPCIAGVADEVAWLRTAIAQAHARM
jgi:hypothetical protein